MRRELEEGAQPVRKMKSTEPKRSGNSLPCALLISPPASAAVALALAFRYDVLYIFSAGSKALATI